MIVADGHCHLGSVHGGDGGERSVHDEIKFVLNGTHQQDWPQVLATATARPQECLPQLGLHPWHVPDAIMDVDAALEDLRHLLEGRPDVGLGECGLDKSAKWADTFDVQLHAFRRQIDMAVSLRRPLTVHCVRCASQMLDIIREDVKGRVPVLLHGWGESAEMTQMFARLDNVYFSLNLALLNRPVRRKVVAMIQRIPLDRLVLESDGPDGRLGSKDNWRAWFKECGENRRMHPNKDILKTPTGANGHSDVPEADIESAISKGSLTSVRLMAHAVGAAVGHPSDVIMAKSAENIERIFVFTTSPI